MSDQNNGGPAFPQLAELGDIAYSTGGMTLRDYFAAKAMASAIASRRYPMPEEIAVDAYEYADAMLRARDS